MWKKCKISDLKVGLPVKCYPSQEWVEYIRFIDNENVYFSSAAYPYMRTYIPLKYLGREFYELYYDDGIQPLFEVY